MYACVCVYVHACVCVYVYIYVYECLWMKVSVTVEDTKQEQEQGQDDLFFERKSSWIIFTKKSIGIAWNLFKFDHNVAENDFFFW